MYAEASSGQFILENQFCSPHSASWYSEIFNLILCRLTRISGREMDINVCWDHNWTIDHKNKTPEYSHLRSIKPFEQLVVSSKVIYVYILSHQAQLHHDSRVSGTRKPPVYAFLSHFLTWRPSIRFHIVFVLTEVFLSYQVTQKIFEYVSNCFTSEGTKTKKREVTNVKGAKIQIQLILIGMILTNCHKSFPWPI